jgi:hypothetical protein
LVRFSGGFGKLLIQFVGEVWASALETLEVDCFVVRDTVAPAHEHDALPLKGQSADGGGIGFAAGELILNKHLRPTAVEHGLAGVFEEALMDEGWPGPASISLDGKPRN